MVAAVVADEVNGFVRNVLAEDLEIIAVIKLVHARANNITISKPSREVSDTNCTN
jgi:hypothetical protein